MAKRDFPSNKKRAQWAKTANRIDLAGRLMELGQKPMTNTEAGRMVADQGTAGLVPNKAGKKMQAKKKLQTGRDIPLPKSNF